MGFKIMGTSNSTPVRKRGILVLGSFGCKNFGDNSFFRVLSKYLVAHNVTVTFCGYDQVTREMARRADLIVLGGGDVLQLSYIHQLERVVLPHKTCPIYAVGVSIPHANIVSTGRLDLIDKFWCRFNSDVQLLQTRYPKHVNKLDDLAIAIRVPRWRPRAQHIGLCLSRTLIHGNEIPLMRQVSKLIQQLHSRGWHVNWLAFNRDASENDAEMFRMLTPEARQLTHMCTGDLLKSLARQSVIIASRFHANVFAHTIGAPVVSLEHTRKVHEWNVEHGVSGVALPRVCDCVGGCVRCTGFAGTVREIPIAAVLLGVNTVVAVAPNFGPEQLKIEATLGQIAAADYLSRYVPPYATDRDTIYQRSADIYFRYLRREITALEFAGTVCALVTGNPEHRFRDGLAQTLGNVQFDLHNAVDYMISKHAEEPQWNRSLWSNDQGCFSLCRTHQPRFEGVHRAGWTRVLDHLAPLHTDRGIIMDTFVDRTFGWHARELEAAGMIPYREPWCGFIHHPPYAPKGANDCAHMVANEAFQASLMHCERLFVMSTELHDWLRAQAHRPELQRLASIPIHVIMHPTDQPEVRFEWGQFMANPDRCVVQVGAWCRDPGAIFRLQSPLPKAALKTRDMDEYMRFSADGECRTVVDIDTLFPDQRESVRLIEFLPNDRYDQLLARNIVFLPLKAAAACNTLLECIARHTPILVPRLPAVEEYLGAAYPLYYADEADAERLLADMTAIRAAHEYLRTYNTDHLAINRFVDAVREAFAPKIKKWSLCGAPQ